MKQIMEYYYQAPRHTAQLYIQTQHQQHQKNPLFLYFIGYKYR